MKKLLEGRRIIKTGVAIFVTAWLCELLGWPAVFAVITAIVTIEPTVSDSIKKGIVRFPASAIGSAYAVTFISLFGNSPITYTLAAVLTIATCYRLNLHAGLLVATLTSVAMIEVVHEHFFIAFLIRLGTTTIGLVVSTLVNMFVLPPDYREEISNEIRTIENKTATLLKELFADRSDGKSDDQPKFAKALSELEKAFQNLETLIDYQKNDQKYRPFKIINSFQAEEKAMLLERMREKIHRLLYHPMHDAQWQENEKELIEAVVTDLAGSLLDESNFDPDSLLEKMKKINEIVWREHIGLSENNLSQELQLPPKFILCYELLALFHLMEDYSKLKQKSG